MGADSLWHWIIVIIIVPLLFGRGRVSDLMGDVARGIKEFKRAMSDEEDHARSASLNSEPVQKNDDAQTPTSGRLGSPSSDQTP